MNSNTRELVDQLVYLPWHCDGPQVKKARALFLDGLQCASRQRRLPQRFDHLPTRLPQRFAGAPIRRSLALSVWQYLIHMAVCPLTPEHAARQKESSISPRTFGSGKRRTSSSFSSSSSIGKESSGDSCSFDSILSKHRRRL